MQQRLQLQAMSCLNLSACSTRSQDPPLVWLVLLCLALVTSSGFGLCDTKKWNKARKGSLRWLHYIVFFFLILYFGLIKDIILTNWSHARRRTVRPPPAPRGPRRTVLHWLVFSITSIYRTERDRLALYLKQERLLSGTAIAI